MSLTSNLVNPVQLRALTAAIIAKNFNLYRAGIASLEMPDQIVGEYYQFRSRKPLGEDSTVNDGTSTDASVETFSHFSQKGPVIKRFKPATFTAAEITQAEEMGIDEFTSAVVAPAFADYWVGEFERLTCKVLTGLFDASAGCLKDTHLVSVAEAFSMSSCLLGKNKLGEKQLDLGAIFVHSDVFHDMQLEGRVEWLEQIGAVRMEKAIRVYEGLAIHVDDSLPTSGTGATKTYDSYLLAPGALQFAVSREIESIAQDVANPPSRTVSQYCDFVVHVPGTNYAASTLPPTDAALAAAASWTKVETENRNIKAVCVRSYSSVNAV